MLTHSLKLESDAVYQLNSVAEQLGIPRSTLLSAIKKAELRATKRGAFWFIAGCDLKNWLIPGSPTLSEAGHG